MIRLDLIDRRHDALMLANMDTEPAPLTCCARNGINCDQGRSCPSDEDDRKPPMTGIDVLALIVAILCSLGLFGILVDQALRMIGGGK